MVKRISQPNLERQAELAGTANNIANFDAAAATTGGFGGNPVINNPTGGVAPMTSSIATAKGGEAGMIPPAQVAGPYDGMTSEQLNAATGQTYADASRFGINNGPPPQANPIPGSDEAILQSSSEQVDPVGALPIGHPDRMAAIEAGSLEPTDADFAYEEQMYNKTQELDLLRKQQAVTSDDSPQAVFQAQQESALTNDINALMKAPEMGQIPEMGGFNFALPEEGLPPEIPGQIPGLSAPVLPNDYSQIVTDTPLQKADSNIRLATENKKKEGLAMIQQADKMAAEAEEGIRNANSASEIEKFQRMAENAKQQKINSQVEVDNANSEQAQIIEQDKVSEASAQEIYDREPTDDLRAARNAALSGIGAKTIEESEAEAKAPVNAGLTKENQQTTKLGVTKKVEELGPALDDESAADAEAAGKEAFA